MPRRDWPFTFFNSLKDFIFVTGTANQSLGWEAGYLSAWELICLGKKKYLLQTSPKQRDNPDLAVNSLSQRFSTGAIYFSMGP